MTFPVTFNPRASGRWLSSAGLSPERRSLSYGIPQPFSGTRAAIALAVLLFSLDTGCKTGRESRKMVTVDKTSNNTQVLLRIGQELEVNLPENPTTGFRWQMIVPGDPIVERLDDSFDSSGPAVGSGGTRHWRFRALQAGLADIEMIYRRAWQQDQSPAETFRLTVRVER